MAITRITAVWTGFQGGPGYTNFFFNAFGGGDVVDLEAARVFTFFARLQSILPSDVNVEVMQEAAILDEATGALIDYAQASDSPGDINGQAAGAYSAPSGAAITWNTAAIARGRRLRGRTFVVPLSNGAYEADGTLASAAIGDLNNAAEGLIGDGAGPEAVIWSRPRDGAGGTIGAITGYRVADQAAVLRSRRD